MKCLGRYLPHKNRYEDLLAKAYILYCIVKLVLVTSSQRLGCRKGSLAKTPDPKHTVFLRILSDTSTK